MGNRAAFDTYLKELRKQGGTATAIDIGDACGNTSASVNGVFNYHLDACKKKGSKPAIIKVQNGVWSTQEQMPKAAPKPAPRPKAKAKVMEDDLFELIGSTGDGTIIVRGATTSTMYRLGEL